MKTIIMLSGIPYRSTRQRPQHMALFFAQQGYRILYLSLTEINSNLTEVHRSGTGDLLDRFFERTDEGIHILKKIEMKIDLNPGFGFDDLLHKLEIYFSPKDVIFIVSFPDWIQYLNKVSNESKIIYDCLDDWESFISDLDLGYTETTIHNERKLASLADLIIVSARSLYVKMARFNDNLYYLPNGVWNADYGSFGDEIPIDIRNIKKPIVFFMGAIAGWVDIDLIKYLADARPEYSFVFVGDEVKVKLPTSSNIHFLGRKKYEDLPLYLKEAKVAIIPFKVNKLTTAVTPLKFYEYLSSSTPVVTTIMPDLIGLPGSKMAWSYEDFLKHLDAYILMDNDQYQLEANRASQTSKRFEWAKLLEPLCSFFDGKDFILLPKSEFINEMINSYRTFQEQEYIQNELITLYNSTGQYQMSCSLFNKHENIEERHYIDYNQLALAYFKQGDVEYSICLLKKYLTSSKNHLFEVYVESIINDENRLIFLELFLLKKCGFIYEALKKSDELYPEWKTNPKFLGLLCGLYMDLGEYDLALHLAIKALDVGEEYTYEEIFDFYSLSFLIKQLSKQKIYDAAENIAISLMKVNQDWEEKTVKILADIYIMRELETVWKA